MKPDTILTCAKGGGTLYIIYTLGECAVVASSATGYASNRYKLTANIIFIALVPILNKVIPSMILSIYKK